MAETIYNDAVQVEVIKTQSGKFVGLFPDRTWSYLDECEGEWAEIPKEL
jgi:hypothetical protein